MNENSIRVHKQELDLGAVLIYDDGAFSLSEEDQKLFADKQVHVCLLRLLELAKASGGSLLMKNTVSLGAVWKVLGLEFEIMSAVIQERFAKKAEVAKINSDCARAGFDAATLVTSYDLTPPEVNAAANQIIITGNEALSLGAIASGVRLYSSYPMTPASSILAYLADEGPKYGMIVKQAEDEITAVNMVIGASTAGTRAMCGTSGGGFDLMTEGISLAGILETPLVVVLGQRPGPATGVPTWTTQGDLNLAIHGGHGEFPRIVMAPGDAEEAFYMMNSAHNLADKYQTPVIFMTDKMMGESSYCHPTFDQSKLTIERGKLVSGAELEQYQDKMRYADSDDGVSARWLPGDAAAPYLANSDEHTERGFSTEESAEIKMMMDKRMRKAATIKTSLPEPIVYGDMANSDVSIISWGSNKGTIIDAMSELEKSGIKVAYLHIQYLWPLRTELLTEFMKQAKYLIALECNFTGQLAGLIKNETGVDIKDRMLRYDGRPFYVEEIVEHVQKIVKT